MLALWRQLTRPIKTQRGVHEWVSPLVCDNPEQQSSSHRLHTAPETVPTSRLHIAYPAPAACRTNCLLHCLGWCSSLPEWDVQKPHVNSACQLLRQKIVIWHKFMWLCRFLEGGKEDKMKWYTPQLFYLSEKYEQQVDSRHKSYTDQCFKSA